jgi:hypothetical protein
MNLLSRSCATEGFIAFDATQAKERNYHNRHPTDQILHLTIEEFEYLHKNVYVFLHDYANAIWSLKELKGLHLFVLVFFYSQKNFNHITKDASIFHFKSGDNHRPNYLLTSNLLK